MIAVAKEVYSQSDCSIMVRIVPIDVLSRNSVREVIHDDLTQGSEQLGKTRARQ